MESKVKLSSMAVNHYDDEINQVLGVEQNFQLFTELLYVQTNAHFTCTTKSAYYYYMIFNKKLIISLRAII